MQLRTHHESARSPRSIAIDHETILREEMATADHFDAAMLSGDEEPSTNDDRMLSTAQLASHMPSVSWLKRVRPKRECIRIAKNYFQILADIIRHAKTW